jgi:hypothetical protein
MFDALSILVSRLLQQPLGCKYGRGLAAALPASCYAHLAKHKNVMRPTGEASKPDLSISIAVLFGAFVIGFAPPPHRASWLRGFVAMHPSGSIP